MALLTELLHLREPGPLPSNPNPEPWRAQSGSRRARRTWRRRTWRCWRSCCTRVSLILHRAPEHPNAKPFARAERLQAGAADLAQENVALLAELLHLRGTAAEKRAGLDEIARLQQARGALGWLMTGLHMPEL